MPYGTKTRSRKRELCEGILSWDTSREDRAWNNQQKSLNAGYISSYQCNSIVCFPDLVQGKETQSFPTHQTVITFAKNDFFPLPKMSRKSFQQALCFRSHQRTTNDMCGKMKEIQARDISCKFVRTAFYINLLFLFSCFTCCFYSRYTGVHLEIQTRFWFPARNTHRSFSVNLYLH